MVEARVCPAPRPPPERGIPRPRGVSLCVVRAAREQLREPMIPGRRARSEREKQVLLLLAAPRSQRRDHPLPSRGRPLARLIAQCQRRSQPVSPPGIRGDAPDPSARLAILDPRQLRAIPNPPAPPVAQLRPKKSENVLETNSALLEARSANDRFPSFAGERPVEGRASNGGG